MLYHNLLFISMTEILFIVFVAFLLFGTKKIPEVARGLGKGYKEFQKASDQIKEEINKVKNDIKDETNKVTDDIKNETNKVTNDIKDEVNKGTYEDKDSPKDSNNRMG